MLGVIDIAKNKFQSFLGDFGDMAKTKYNTAMLEHKLKSNINELNLIYKSIGILVYEKKLSDDKDALKLFASIEHYKNIITQIEKSLLELKKSDGRTEIPEKRQTEKIEKADYAKPVYDEHDLILTRTNDGIKLVRFCPKCDHANDSDKSFCENCGEKIH